MKGSSRWLVYALALLASATPALAQTFHGGLRGAVREAGGVVPGATVTLTNEATSVSRATQTNHVGEYAFVSVDPGDYTLKVSMQGFKSIENRGIHIGTQQFLTLDFALEVGNLQEAITVEGATPLETSNASVGSTLDSKTLETLPSAGRNPFFLATITPGVTHTGDPQFIRQQDQTNSSLLSLAGGPRRANNYTLDGVSIVDLRNRATIIPSIESVEEVKVQVSTYDAEMGRTGGGVFNMTGKSGANAWHGSALGEARPGGARALSFFAQKACDADPSACAKPATYAYIYGGSLGGPIVKNKTFFWASIEGYKTKTIDDAVVRAPSQREISGDFSQSGVTIYDPLTTRRLPDGSYTRDPFPGNVIPASRFSPVAQAMQKYWPNAGPASAALVDVSKTATFKLDQQWSPSFHSSAMYGYYHSREPQPRSYLKNGVTQDIGANPADPGDGALLRTVHVIAVNNTITPNPTTAAHVRFGYTTFSDDCVPIPFDPGTLGFSSGFVNEVPQKKFPYFGIGGYGTDYNGYMFGDRPVNTLSYYSWDANASISKLWGPHTVKFGASYRKIGLKAFSGGQTSGLFNFDGQFTAGPDAVNATASDPNALAAFLLGFPSSGSIPVATPNNFFINYYAGYAQDDFRVNPNLTVNLGLRYEFEQGLQETNNAFTVGFDRTRNWPFQVPGVTLKGGLMYAGVDGYPTHQSDPSKTKFGPRAGFAWSVDPKTVVRGGYGLFWAPHQYASSSSTNLGTRGFTGVTDYVATTDGVTPCAGCSIVNPFPNGIQKPSGSASGILTGAGGTVEFIDQFRQSAYVHQFSLDLQRELPGNIVAGVGYIGAHSEHLGMGGNDSGTVNINQLDPKYLALGSALLDQVPNPFFGDPRFGSFADTPTIARRQLLRPYPQFGDLLAHQVSAGHATYHSLIVRLERRITNGWGGRINYTFASNKTNVFGEHNQFSNDSNSLSRPLNSYNLDAEYSNSVTEQPHRLNFALTAELPFGKGKGRLSEPGLARTLFGGWALTAMGYFQSGFPVVVNQSNNNTGIFSRLQRPNLTGTSPATSGGTESHYDPACSCIDNWFNPAAWSTAPAFTFGNAPRTDTRMRTPFKTQTDVALQKVEPVGGSKTIMVRAEMINIFNNTQFNGPNTTFGSSSFGFISSSRGFPRMLQLMVRFAF